MDGDSYYNEQYLVRPEYDKEDGVIGMVQAIYTPDPPNPFHLNTWAGQIDGHWEICAET